MIYIWIYMYIHDIYMNIHGYTEWRRLIGSPKLQIIFHKRATKYRLFCGKWPIKMKDPMILRHPVFVCAWGGEVMVMVWWHMTWLLHVWWRMTDLFMSYMIRRHTFMCDCVMTYGMTYSCHMSHIHVWRLIHMLHDSVTHSESWNMRVTGGLTFGPKPGAIDKG